METNDLAKFGFAEPGKSPDAAVLLRALLDQVNAAAAHGDDPEEALWELGLWLQRETRYNLFELLDEDGVEKLGERLFPLEPERWYAFVEGAFSGP